jgi:hypothetical protein
LISRLRNYATTIVGELVTIGLTLISDFVLKFDNQITWLTFFIGSIVTLTAALLEQRIIDVISTEFNRKLEIYRLLSQIEDQELQQLGNEAIIECVRKLQDYERGFIPLTVHNRYTNRVSKCQKSMKAVFWAHDIQELFKFNNDFVAQNYYKANVEAHKKRGVQVRRIFILDRKTVLDSQNLFSNGEVLKILSMHQNDGLMTNVAWLDDWNSIGGRGDLFRDFVIFDDSEVMIQSYDIGNRARGSILIKYEAQVKEYRKFFQVLENISCSLDEVIAKYAHLNN